MSWNKGMVSRMRWDWRTPKSLFEELNKEFGFDCDPCLIARDNSIHLRDMLGSDWGNRCFVNPPYQKLKEWTAKAKTEFHKGKLVVLLIPSRTDTAWWHEDVMESQEIRFLRGRLKFDDIKTPAPFPSCLVIFDPKRVLRNKTPEIKSINLKPDQKPIDEKSLKLTALTGGQDGKT